MVSGTNRSCHLSLVFLPILALAAIAAASKDAPVDMCKTKINFVTLQTTKSSAVGWTTINGQDYVIKKLSSLNDPAAVRLHPNSPIYDERKPTNGLEFPTLINETYFD
jgi:hypothetical protein